jgi:hypothetical protein
VFTAGCGLASAATTPRPLEEMPEVQILASRVKPSELRAELIKAEDAFYAQFNQLVEDPELRVWCRTEPPIGSHIHRRVCEAQFVESARAVFAREMIQGLGDAALGGTYLFPAPPDSAIANTEVTFHREIERLIRDNASLRELAHRRAMLEVLLKAAQKARSRGGP